MDVIATTNGTTTPTPGTTAALILSVPEMERNGVLKRPKYPHVVVGCGGDVVYKECLKNHAASSGGHALDGCGEFMPARTATAIDPTSLKCAACGCHRNFHRREKLSPTSAAAAAAAAATATTRLIEYHPQHRHHPPQPLPTLPGATSPGSDDDQSPPPISSAYYPTSAPQMLLALSDNAKINSASAAAAAAAAADSNGVCQQQQQQQQQQQMFSSVSPHLSSRKRFRTKFSPDQKERMQEFAEKLGWKMQKSTDELVKGFCNDIGVQREVFKVWMHNNKNTFGRRSASNYVITASNQGINDNVNPIKEDYENVNENGIGIGVGNSHSSSINNSNCISDHHQQQFNNGRSHHSAAAPTNASSSSS